MTKENIIKILKEHDNTVLSFPNRNNEWGSNKYRGNCSGWVHAFLIWKYHVQKMAELFAGSGTGYDVANDMGIDYIGADLNPNPVRDKVLCVNAVTDEVPQEFYGADMMFLHPPYGAEINIPYAGNMYPDPTGVLSKSDLGQMKWDEFMKTLNEVVMKYYASMEKGARMSILMGDVRRNGFHSMLTDIVKPGQLEQIIIKQQHNYSSFGRTYANSKFVPIAHEYIMVLKKLSPYIIDFMVTNKKSIDIRDSKCATWADVVFAALSKIGKRATLSQIYTEIEGHKKCDNNSHWKEKVRQTLQNYKFFANDGRGVWQIVN